VFIAKGIKIICQGGLGNDMSQVREGKTVVASDFMSTFGDILKPCSIDQGNGGCHHGKVDVIHDGMGIPCLAFAAPDVLFDLFEAGFDFPSCAIVLDDLLSSQMEVGRKECNPLCFTKNPLCKQHLSSFKKPREIYPIEKLSRNAMGKY